MMPASDADQPCLSLAMASCRRVLKQLLMLRIDRYSRRGWPPMDYRIRRAVATWLGVVALICQVFLPFGHNPVAELLGIDCPGLVEATNDHHHDADQFADRSSGQEPLRHSHHEHQRSCPVCVDLQFAAPLIVVEPPALPMLALHWLAFRADWIAAAPSAAEAFSRPLPRAPPLPA